MQHMTPPYPDITKISKVSIDLILICVISVEKCNVFLLNKSRAPNYTNEENTEFAYLTTFIQNCHLFI